MDLEKSLSALLKEHGATGFLIYNGSWEDKGNKSILHLMVHENGVLKSASDRLTRDIIAASRDGILITTPEAHTLWWGQKWYLSTSVHKLNLRTASGDYILETGRECRVRVLGEPSTDRALRLDDPVAQLVAMAYHFDFVPPAGDRVLARRGTWAPPVDLSGECVETLQLHNMLAVIFFNPGNERMRTCVCVLMHECATIPEFWKITCGGCRVEDHVARLVTQTDKLTVCQNVIAEELRKQRAQVLAYQSPVGEERGNCLVSLVPEAFAHPGSVATHHSTGIQILDPSKEVLFLVRGSANSPRPQVFNPESPLGMRLFRGHGFHT